MDKGDKMVIYGAVVLILVVDTLPLLSPFPQSRTYLDEKSEGQITVVYESKEQYIRERTIPTTTLTLTATAAWYLLFGGEQGVPHA